VTEHEVPEGDAPKVAIRITGRPLTFPIRRSITLVQIGGEISTKKIHYTSKDDAFIKHIE